MEVQILTQDGGVMEIEPIHLSWQLSHNSVWRSAVPRAYVVSTTGRVYRVTFSVEEWQARTEEELRDKALEFATAVSMMEA